MLQKILSKQEGKRSMRNSTFRKRLLAGTLLAGILPGCAFAQSATPAPAADAVQKAAGANSSQDSAGGATLGDIIVTAQKRSERLQNVPVAVTALGGPALQAANVNDTKGLSAVVPSLNFTQSASFAQPFIRGVGSRGNTAGDEQIVPIYVDGVYQVGMTAGIFNLNSIDRIEVLRGPQGTLFGRNAVGGAINVVTRDPSFTRTAEFGVGYGRFSEFWGDFYASGPITKTLAANIAVIRHQDDGYSRDVLRGTHEAASYTTSVRSKLLWEPTTDFEAKLTGYYIKANDASGVASFPLHGNTAARRVDPTVFIGSGYNLSNSFSPFANTEGYGASLDLTYHLNGVDLSSLTSNAFFKSTFKTDNDATGSLSASPLANSSFLGEDKHFTFTQEWRAASAGNGPFKWLAGAYFFHDLLKNPYPFYQNFPGLNVTNRGETSSFAFFGELEYSLTSDLSAKIGGRYSEDDRKADTFDFLVNKRISAERSWHDFSPRFTLDYAFASRQRVYFTFSEAFKSGIIVQPVLTSSLNFVNVVDPEKLRSYEVGYKGDITSNFRANLASYYYDYKNVQVPGQGVLPSGAIFSFLQNAAKEKIYGVDADLTYAPTRDWTMGLSVAWMYAHYESFHNASVQIPRLDGMGNVTATIDATGKQVQRAPTFTAGFNGTYTVPADVFGGKVRLSGNLLYNSGWYFDFIERVGTGDYIDLNARISWTSPDDRLTASLWGKNLTDNHRLLAVTESGGADRASLVRPITYGTELRFKF
jgi:iron complex outermembrane receptor protein